MVAGAPGKAITIVLPAGLYDLDAIKLAAYRFADKASATIEPTGGAVTCRLAALHANVDLVQLEAHFRNEVIDQDLRKRIAKETESVRNLVLSLAFSRTGLQG